MGKVSTGIRECNSKLVVMRRDFHPLLLEAMRKDDRIWVLTADLGYKFFDNIAVEFPDRFVNVGAAEQLLLGAAVGLAEEGKIPICYTISSFYWRAAEWIRNYLHHEQVPVKCIGGGRGSDYEKDGFTHFCGDDSVLFGCFDINCYWPNNTKEMESDFQQILCNGKPCYLNLRR